MSSGDVRSQLRGAVYRGDGAALVELLGRAWPDGALQLVGDGLGAAMRDRLEGAASLAARCLTDLRVRGWEGDEELADSLEAALDPSRTPALTPLPVDLEELAMSLEVDDPDRWLWFDSVGSHDAYRDMERFIASLDDEDIADRLAIAIKGRGVFRRFKDTLYRWPELMTRWHAFSEERQRGRARSWLAEHGYTPATLR